MIYNFIYDKGICNWHHPEINTFFTSFQQYFIIILKVFNISYWLNTYELCFTCRLKSLALFLKPIAQQKNDVTMPLSVTFRSSHRRCSENVFLGISQNLQENTCARVSFLIKLWKKDSGKGVFLWILQNFQEHFFHRTPLGDCFWTLSFFRSLGIVFKLRFYY